MTVGGMAGFPHGGSRIEDQFALERITAAGASVARAIGRLLRGVIAEANVEHALGCYAWSSVSIEMPAASSM